jgi:hypothetical protein
MMLDDDDDEDQLLLFVVVVVVSISGASLHKDVMWFKTIRDYLFTFLIVAIFFSTKLYQCARTGALAM